MQYRLATKPYHKIVIIYLVLASTWILLSDAIVDVLFDDPQVIYYVQSFKGMGFVLFTAGVLYLLIRKDFHAISQLNQNLIKSYEDTIIGWVSVMDLRHKETKDHTERVTKMTVRLAKLAGISDIDELRIIKRGAILHDIGKIGIPDHILIKPGKLSHNEWEEMKLHPVIARDILSKIDFLKPSIDIPYCHHERWDGTGYPEGLKGEQIPLSARLFSVVDVWDALSHPRVYKNAWPSEQVFDYLQEQSGKQFDPLAVELFIGHYDELTDNL